MSQEPAAGPPSDAASLCSQAKELGVDLPTPGAESLLAYLDAMLEVNQQVNLTAIRDREQALVLHVLDGLAAGLHGLRPQHVLDLGSGNGFPGVAVAALHPKASVMLLDRTGKKVRAMGACLMTARLQGIETLQMDAAQAPTLRRDLRQAFDLVTARAVGQPGPLAALAAPLLQPKGQLMLWLDEKTEMPQRVDGFRRAGIVEYQRPAPASRTRRIALLERV
ncbi:MAG: RsmG family class I SAM-dependent methyltransferase [Planctomycetota bacterium]|nr:RsmG family class I SAM-dependent methyltransferase [Planctomycetota bacterium]